ncbi:cyclic pyranopterin phosphate synthase MoaA [Clostridium beijerinckii]|uniref:GTP 3',8-cyclase n=1 Tax=Clostridium beijerinckii TaxID=1520 RepID=A0A0B5QPL6_CLOBE|nr:GTP 3',8-cyclase MoaA [Clostridium beijerinckii]AJH00202.1 cyclic pyranopterin phosphate synthase MoaA [Clostridium beijerinckii]
MIDIYNRKIDYIRISVTDRCNLRCIYCMPESGISFFSHEMLLTYEEITQLCELFVKTGISKVKITGGEPLVRKDLNKLIKSIKDIDGINNITLTTNGILLEEQLDDLIKSGLDAVNISIDTLREDRYREITRVGEVHKVIRGIYKALKYKNLKVKLNYVPIKGKNEDEIIDIINLTKHKDLSVRFIELMPIGLGKDMAGYSDEEIISIIENKIGKMTPYKGKLGNGPSNYFSLDGYKGKIGFISAVSHKFCENCNRVRLTSDGFLKKCLQYEYGCDLKSMLRSGKSNDEILKIIEETIYNKPKNHHFNKENEKNSETKAMFQIGG